MELSRLDLNLLLVFAQLLEHKRVSAVARSLSMSQPAVSNALGRLRTALNDELFLRTPSGMVPTPYALQLARPVAQALQQLQEALHVRASFDPASSERRFTIAMTDVGEMYFLPLLADRLASLAPQVTLAIVSATGASLAEDMAAGRVDLALGLLPQLQAGYFQQCLFRQQYCCLMRQDHPLAAQAELSVDDFVSAEHIRILAAGTGHGRVDAALEKQAVRRRFRLTVAHYVALGDVLRHTQLLATVPERFADRVVQPFALTKRALPVPVPGSAIHQFWHARLHKDPGHGWLRQTVYQLFGDGHAPLEEQAK